jgi:hypothetical protein
VHNNTNLKFIFFLGYACPSCPSCPAEGRKDRKDRRSLLTLRGLLRLSLPVVVVLLSIKGWRCLACVARSTSPSYGQEECVAELVLPVLPAFRRTGWTGRTGRTDRERTNNNNCSVIWVFMGKRMLIGTYKSAGLILQINEIKFHSCI